MDRLQKSEATTRAEGVDGPATARILKFPQRPPRLAAAIDSSAWYHQAAIDAPSRPAAPKR